MKKDILNEILIYKGILYDSLTAAAQKSYNWVVAGSYRSTKTQNIQSPHKNGSVTTEAIFRRNYLSPQNWLKMSGRSSKAKSRILHPDWVCIL